jgi:hypothetical protein
MSHTFVTPNRLSRLGVETLEDQIIPSSGPMGSPQNRSKGVRARLRSWFREWMGHSADRAPADRAAARRIRLGGEALEDRVVPTATLFLDFGDALPGGQLTTTVAQFRDTLANGGVQGPDLSPYLNPGQPSTTPVTITPFAQTVTIDYNGDGVVNATDVAALKADVVATVQRYYQPLNINVQVAAASSLGAVASALQANNLFVGKNDAYVFVGQLQFGGGGGAIPSGLPGLSSTADATAFSNQRDDTSLVFADHVLAQNPTTPMPALATAIAHEAGRDFGLRQTDASDPRAQSDLLATPEIAALTQNLTMFTRYPLFVAPGEIAFPAFYSPFDHLLNDPDIGPRPGAAAYVTGTGANDTITIIRTGPTTASVTVEARDNAGNLYAVPGTSIGQYTYTIDTSNGVLVDAGLGNDTISVDSSIAQSVTVRGMAGNDTLVIQNLTGAASSYSQYDGQIQSNVGGTIFYTPAVENVKVIGGAGADTFTLLSASTTTAFSFSGGGGSDTMQLAYGLTTDMFYSEFPGQYRTGSGSPPPPQPYMDGSIIMHSGGVTYVPAEFFSDVEMLNVFGGGGNDELDDFGTSQTAVQFIGNGGTDTLAARFAQVMNLPTTLYEGSNTILANNGGAFAPLYFQPFVGKLIVYGGTSNDTLTLLTPSTTMAFSFWGGGGSDTMQVAYGLTDMHYTQYTGQYLPGSGYPLPPSPYLYVDGSIGMTSGGVTYTTAEFMGDVELVNVFGGGGNDSLDVFGTSRTAVQFIGNGGTDTLTIKLAQVLNLNTTYTQTTNTIIANNGTYFGALYFQSDVKVVRIDSGTGNDTLTINAPSTTTQFYFSGGAGTDSLFIYKLPSTPFTTGPGTVTISGYQPISFLDVENTRFFS